MIRPPADSGNIINFFFGIFAGSMCTGFDGYILLAETMAGDQLPPPAGMRQTSFTLRSAPVQWDRKRPDIMKTFWCKKKNSIVAWINGGVDFRPALERCSMAKCPLWDDGFCDHLDIRDAGQ